MSESLSFTVNDVRRMADNGTFARGLDYFKRGRVREVEFDRLHAAYLGRVSGSRRRPYEVCLWLEGDELTCDCSCPVGIDCKHGVATALQVIRDEQHATGARGRYAGASGTSSAQPGSWQHWLAALPRDARQAPQSPGAGRHYLLYFLEARFDRVWLVTKKAYLKQDGSWSQLKHHTQETSSLAWHRPGHLLAEDVTILQLLDRGSGDWELGGEHGRLALNHLLASGRLYCGEQPVRQAPAKTLHWEWRQADGLEEGDRQLTAQLDGVDEWQLLAVSPPAYLDIANGAVGDLLTPLAGAQLQHLFTMPPVRGAELAQMALQLRREIPQDRLPLPVEPDLTIVDTFTPHLTLVSCDLGGLTLPGLKLHFDYGGVARQPACATTVNEEPAPVERDGCYYQVERDLEREYACCDRVHALGLYLEQGASGAEAGTWIPDADTPQGVLACWRRLEREALPALAQEGWVIEVGSDYRFEVTRAGFDIALRDAPRNWFDFALDLSLADGRRLDTAEVVALWLAQDAPEELLLNLAGDWVSVDARPLQGIRGLLTELFNQNKLGKTVRLPPFQAAQFDNIPDLDQRRAPATRELQRSLRDYAGLEQVPVPAGVHAELRAYQRAGLNWLVFLQRYGFGGILADDMGLGKTLQALALIQHLKETGQLEKPALVVAPTSLTGNWLHEAARFTPELEVTLIHGPERADAFRRISRSDMVITTYPLLPRDSQHYRKCNFSLLVLDEAQAIKNPNTKIAGCVRDIHSNTRLCLTGTPLENHLGELWALMDFALPGLLGGRKGFGETFRKPIERDGDSDRQRELARRVGPFLLRRAKAEVATELPPKTETVQYVTLSGKQRHLYESIRIAMEQRIRELVERQGMAKSHIQFLDALLKLRQACIDPRLVKLEQADGVRESAKLDWLAQTLPQLLEEGRAILVFSQFTQVLKLIEEQLKTANLAYTKLTGQTRKRQAAIDRFQSGDVKIFLISLKAGGSGLNLVAADVVIHMDPWWNPAVENQATDRAHRIGQDKPVFVYKLVAADTVEERIHQMQREKQALADALFDASRSAGLPADADALLELLTS